MRDVSFYGQQLCDGHFCPSYYYISPDEKKSLINILDDWYSYGLCVTDIDLVKEFFRITSEMIGGMPSPSKFLVQGIKHSAKRFFSLKTSWPYRSIAVNRFGKYYFDGSQYMIHQIDYDALGCEKSRFNKIFLSLSTEFKTAAEVRAAENIIEDHLEDFVHAFAKSEIR